MDALVSLSQAMTIEEEEPVHIVVGDKQSLLELQMAISHADYVVGVLCRNFSIPNAVRTMLSQAKQPGVNVEICVPSHEFQSIRRTLS